MSPPPDGYPYNKLAKPLRDTIERSFRARIDRISGHTWALDDGTILPPEMEASWNLANGFWGGSPKSAWESLTIAGAEPINMLVRIYDRMAQIDPSLKLWRQIKYIRNGWWGGSGGFKVVYENPSLFREQLASLAHNTAGSKIGRDTFVGSLEHQLESSPNVIVKKLLSAPLDILRSDAAPPDALTFREVDRPGHEALHFCVSIQDQKPDRGPVRHIKLDDIHLDWQSPVAGIGPDGRCQYTDAFNSLKHWAQAMLHVAKPVFWFHDTDELLKALHTPKRPLPEPLAEERDALSAEWEQKKLSIAVLGLSGHAIAANYYSRASLLAKQAGIP